MNAFVDQYMKSVTEDDGLPSKVEALELPEVKELPEEEECDYTTRWTMSNHGRNNTFLKGTPSKDWRNQYSASVMVQHMKCVSTKIQAKYLPEDYNEPVSRKSSKYAAPIKTTSNKAKYQPRCDSFGFSLQMRAGVAVQLKGTAQAAEMKSESEINAGIVLECLNKPGEGPVEYIIDDFVEVAEYKRRAQFSRSLVLPHRSDDPAVDSEELVEEKVAARGAGNNSNSNNKIRAGATTAVHFLAGLC